MRRIEISHLFECTPGEYLGVIDSLEFHERLRGRLGLRERVLLERREEPRGVVVRWHVTPERDLPGPVRAFLGGKGLAYFEEEIQPRESLCREWRVRLDALGEARFRCAGTFELVPRGDGRTRRDLRGEIEVRAFGVGGLVERIVVQGIEESYEKTAALVREMLAERRLAK